VIWKTDLRPATLAWLLGAAFVLGLGVRVVQEVRGRAVSFPLTVVENDAEMLGLKRQADSIIAVRAAEAEAPIGINTATAADFERLNGIGKVLAARIVAYREEHGPFTSLEELTNVSGIGPKRLAAMRERCFVDSSAR
jgi:competence ComEA-like helix-hairpin-helix protein